MQNKSREQILSRRSRFILAGVATLTLGGCASKASVCLDIAPQEDAQADSPADVSNPDTDSSPMVCLKVMPEDAGVDSSAPVDSSNG